jgi:phosphatidate cytidylyltransferase
LKRPWPLMRSATVVLARVMARLSSLLHDPSQPKGPSGLIQRVIVGVLLAVLAVVEIWLGGWPFRLLLLVGGMLVIIEFTAMTGADQSVPGRLLALAGFAMTWLLASLGKPVWAILLVDALALALVTWAIVMRHRPFFWSALALLYASAAVIALIWLRDAENGRIIVLWLVMIVAVTDTAAFFTGRSLKGPKLAPSISPSKTWSGLAGGMAGAALAGAGLALTVGFEGVWQIGLLSAAVAVVAQLGDLLESHIKRTFGVKDSGSMLPGHGGVMDRVDGYMLAAPVVALMMLPMGWGG